MCIYLIFTCAAIISATLYYIILLYIHVFHTILQKTKTVITSYELIQALVQRSLTLSFLTLTQSYRLEMLVKTDRLTQMEMLGQWSQLKNTELQ